MRWLLLWTLVCVALPELARGQSCDGSGAEASTLREHDACLGSSATAGVLGRASAPLPEEARAVLAALPSERIPPPREFYYRSNERRHDLVAELLDGVGGVVLGVGADQLYTLAAYARASLLLAVDYDARVGLVHELYGALVPRSATPAELVAHFDAEREAATVAVLAEVFEGSRERQIVRLYRRTRAQMQDYLARQIGRVREGRAGSWLADAALYDHVRELFLHGRVVARTGDLTGTTTLVGIGAALRRLGAVVRVIYFSNAEQFFAYTPQFRQNMRALPTDAQTLVVRTTRHPSLPNAAGDRWHYVVQDFGDFGARLRARVYGRSTVMLEDLVGAGAPFVGPGISRMTAELPRLTLERWRARAR